MVSVIDPRAWLQNKSQAVKSLRRSQFAACWITAPLRGKHVPAEKYNASCSEVAALLLAAEETFAPCILLGAFGTFWQHEDIHRVSMREAFAKRCHRWCHFGMKVDVPSSACLVSPSLKLPIQNHSCKL